MPLEIRSRHQSAENSMESLTKAAANALNQAILDTGEEAVLLLLSGGSSLALLGSINTQSLGGRVIIAPLDERYSANPNENNMAQIAESEFYSKAMSAGSHFIDTRIKDGESREELAKRFNDSLREWMNENPSGNIIATIGIGPDGHISGVMPFPEDHGGFNENFNDGNSEKLVVGYDAGDKNQFPQRVTTTLNLLRKIDTAIVYAVGENKREAVKKVLADNGDLATSPARILREIEGKVLLFTDAI